MRTHSRPRARTVGVLLATALGATISPAAYGQETPSAAGQNPPSQSQVPPTASNTQENEDLRRELREMHARLEKMEADRAEDRKQIDELTRTIQGLKYQEIEGMRAESLARQIAEIRRELDSRSSGPPAGGQESGAEDELSALIAGASPAPSEKPGGGGVIGSIQSAIQSFNPDISLNGDFLAFYQDREGGHPASKFDFRELEIGFSGAIDPYSRADIIATIGHEDGEYVTELEEAYITLLQLPHNLQARVGKYRAEFGRTNPLHLHALPWPDYPFVIQRYFGEEGLYGVGGELSWLVPNPWDQYIALVYEIMNNDNGTLFAADQADDITQLLRLKSFRELSPASTLEFGGSFAFGPNDHGHGAHRSMVEGLDLTYRWKPKDNGRYRSFLWQNEVLFAQADIRGGQESTWGMYSAAEYQFARQWKVGLRYDNTQMPFRSSLHEYGYSAYLTFLQSEFLFWRLAYTIVDRNFRDEDVSDHQRLMLQMNFTLGAHPGHRY